MTDTQIPPTTVLGPIEAKVPDLVARVRANLHAADDDDGVQGSVDSAIVHVIDQTNRNAIGLPDDAHTCNGIVAYATFLYLDSFSTANGAQIAVGDAAFPPMFLPGRFQHWTLYFGRLYRRWGVA